MRKLFIHQPFFRVLSPLFSGIIIYLLILLLNNNVSALQEQVLGEELYFCIGLSYMVQELSRTLLLVFKRFSKENKKLLYLLFQVLVSLSISVLVVTLVVILYYKYVIGFSAALEEIVTLDSIFAVITFLYILLFISHEYLYKVNSEKLQQEELNKQIIEEDFRQFKRGINPSLLFESFEALIVLMDQNAEKADEFIDHLSTIYRYILSSKDRQLVNFQEEYANLIELEQLFNKLPYRNLAIESHVKTPFLVVPGTLLFVVEFIVRNTIISADIQLKVSIYEENNFLVLMYKTHDKINANFNTPDFEEICRVYAIYNEQIISIQKSDENRKIMIPKLTLKKNP